MSIIVPNVGQSIITSGFGPVKIGVIPYSSPSGEVGKPPVKRYRVFYIDKTYEFELQALNVISPYSTSYEVKPLSVVKLEKAVGLLEALKMISPHETTLTLDETGLNELLEQKADQIYLVNPFKLRKAIETIINQILGEIEK